jgi:asparagine synthase (glutamine-hydrolysing)
MCGIAGIYNYKTLKPAPAESLKDMAGCLTHRGPDDEGFYHGAGLGFAFRRLSIIDLEGGAQPIPHCYEEYGASFVKHLRGMFALAIWDSNGRKAILARDRLGIKPLYYSDDRSSFVFGSEIKAILASGLVDRDVDLQALCDYITFRYVPAPATLFRGIMKLPPGHLLTVDERGVRLDPYWNFQFENNGVPKGLDVEGRLNELLAENVKLRLMSDVPLGALLSGGIDSSLMR